MSNTCFKFDETKWLVHSLVCLVKSVELLRIIMNFHSFFKTANYFYCLFLAIKFILFTPSLSCSAWNFVYYSFFSFLSFCRNFESILRSYLVFVHSKFDHSCEFPIMISLFTRSHIVSYILASTSPNTHSIRCYWTKSMENKQTEIIWIIWCRVDGKLIFKTR